MHRKKEHPSSTKGCLASKKNKEIYKKDDGTTNTQEKIMSLPTRATFRNKNGEILATGFCNAGWTLTAKNFIPMVREALVESRIRSYLMNGGTYSERVFKTEDEYDRMKKLVEGTGVTIEALREEYGEKYFSEDWQRQWHDVEISGIRILRSDLMTASSDALYEEEFVKRLYQVMKNKAAQDAANKV